MSPHALRRCGVPHATQQSCTPSVRCSVFPLEDLVAAHEFAERGHVRGKVGITISPDLVG